MTSQMKSTRRSFIKKTAVAGSAVYCFAPNNNLITHFGTNDRLMRPFWRNGRGKTYPRLMAQKNVRVTNLM